MTDRPILFSAPMIHALLAGRKTQTRRLVWTEKHVLPPGAVADRNKGYSIVRRLSPATRIMAGDRLWVRETLVPLEELAANGASRGIWLHYEADMAPVPGNRPGHKLVPSIHMPRALSRLTLEVTAIRMQRLQEISEADAMAEGVTIIAPPDKDGMRHFSVPGVEPRIDQPTAKRAFTHLWRAIHGIDSWDANPEVIAISFTVHQRNIDA